jgi:hypothetical protein
MMKLYYWGFFCVLVMCASAVHAQDAAQLTGAQILRTARTIYDQGRLHELPAYLDARKFDRLNTTEKVEAYKILVLTYIYLEEPAKADENMLAILETDHFFEPIESDQNEFKNLYKKFRTKPVITFGVRGGLNQTLVTTMENDFITAESENGGTYTPNLGFNVMLSVEKQFGERFVINPEIGFITSAFTYNNENVFSDDPDEDGSVDQSVATHKFTQSRGQLNLLVHYKLFNAAKRKQKGLGKSTLDPYVFAGPAAGYLLQSTFDGILELPDAEQTVDNTDSFSPLSVSAVVGAGIKYKMGPIYLTADLRYQHGLLNVTNEKNRYAQSPENIVMTRTFGYVQDNMSLNHAMIQVGITYPYFVPKKLIK